MSNIPVYMVANLEIEDAAVYRIYEKGFFRIFKRHGGEFFTCDDFTENFEGCEPLTEVAGVARRCRERVDGGYSCAAS
jgi:uncharacterized protein (DUF1330 family)